MPRTPSLRTMKKAQQLLQEVHDNIEHVGFSIMRYGGYGLGSGVACYIGNVRQAAGLRGSPNCKGAHKGDGPQLPLALQAMDDAARGTRHSVKRVEALLDEREKKEPGRYVEQVGLCYHHRQPEALRIVRKALTDLHYKIEAKEAAA